MKKNLLSFTAVGMIITAEKCVIRKRIYNNDIEVYDVMSKSDILLENTNVIEQ